jgi:hypothetical protein
MHPNNQIDLLGKTKTNVAGGNLTVSNGISNNFRTTMKSQLKPVQNPQQTAQEKAYKIPKQTLQ